MNLTALNYAIQLLATIPSLIKSGQDVVAAVQEGSAKLSTFQAENRDPTQAEWDELDARVKTLQDELHAGEQAAGSTIQQTRPPIATPGAQADVPAASAPVQGGQAVGGGASNNPGDGTPGTAWNDPAGNTSSVLGSQPTDGGQGPSGGFQVGPG